MGKSKKKATEQSKADAAAEEPKAEASDREEWPENGYKVAKGESICTGKRIIPAGEAVEPKHLHDDDDVAQRNFDRLYEMGLIVKA